MRMVVETWNRWSTAAFDGLDTVGQAAGTGGVWIVYGGWVAALVLVVFKYCVDPDRLRRCKAYLQADLLGLLLFGRHGPAAWVQHKRLLADLVGYWRCVAWALLVLALPLGVCLIQMEARLGYRPLNPGETALLHIHVPGTDLHRTIPVALSSAAGLAVETAGVRLPDTDRVVWRIRAVQPGVHRLIASVNGDAVTKQVVVGPLTADQRLVSRVRSGGHIWDLLNHPGEAPLDPASPIRAIAVDYPPRRWRLLAWEGPWWVPVGLVTALCLYGGRRLLQIEF